MCRWSCKWRSRVTIEDVRIRRRVAHAPLRAHRARSAVRWPCRQALQEHCTPAAQLHPLRGARNEPACGVGRRDVPPRLDPRRSLDRELEHVEGCRRRRQGRRAAGTEQERVKPRRRRLHRRARARTANPQRRPHIRPSGGFAAKSRESNASPDGEPDQPTTHSGLWRRRGGGGGGAGAPPPPPPLRLRVDVERIVRRGRAVERVPVTVVPPPVRVLNVVGKTVTAV
jgi:hypothetical protein